jgi:biotin operon repressor
MSDSDKRVKVTPDEVWDALADGQWHTNQELCGQFGVANGTIKKNVAILQAVGHCILFGQGGYCLIDDTFVSENGATTWKRNAGWIKGVLGSIARTAIPMHKKGIVTAVRRALPADPEERRGIRQFAVTLQRVIDAAEIENGE